MERRMNGNKGFKLMLSRKLLLLALIQACGGSVSVADCQAMLALFCRRRNKNYYEFFFSHQGYMSLVLAQDKRALAKTGLLAGQAAFTLQQEDTYLEQLKPADRETLLAVAKEPEQILQSQT